VRIVMAMTAAALMVGGMATSSLAAQYPQVANLDPFTMEAGYMSLPGYLRYLTYQQTGGWLTVTEADRIVRQQHAE
jgi:hypothetical protein